MEDQQIGKEDKSAERMGKERKERNEERKGDEGKKQHVCND